MKLHYFYLKKKTQLGMRIVKTRGRVGTVVQLLTDILMSVVTPFFPKKEKKNG